MKEPQKPARLEKIKSLDGRWVVQPRLDGETFSVTFVNQKVSVYYQESDNDYGLIVKKLQQVFNSMSPGAPSMVLSGQVMSIGAEGQLLKPVDQDPKTFKFFINDLQQLATNEPYYTRVKRAHEFVKNAIQEVSNSYFRLGSLENLTFISESPTMELLNKYALNYKQKLYSGALFRREASEEKTRADNDFLEIVIEN